MRRIGPVISIAFLVLLGACSTPYQPAGWFSMRGGYDEKELEPGIWRVTFGGNGYTSRESAQTYWLYRCAELTLEKGYDGFQILSGMQLLEPRIPSDPVVPVSSAPVYIPMYMDESSKPTIQGDIRLLKKPFEPAPPKIFDATELKLALESFVKGDKCGIGNVCPHVHRYLFPREDQRIGQGA